MHNDSRVKSRADRTHLASIFSSFQIEDQGESKNGMRMFHR